MKSNTKNTRNREFRTKPDGEKNHVPVRLMITREQDRRRVTAEQKLALTPEQIFEAGLLYLGLR